MCEVKDRCSDAASVVARNLQWDSKSSGEGCTGSHCLTILLVSNVPSMCRSGGALSLLGPAESLLVGCELKGNRAVVHGGAATLSSSGGGTVTLRLVNTTLTGNAAGSGPDVYQGSNTTVLLGGGGGTPMTAIQAAGPKGSRPRQVPEAEALSVPAVVEGGKEHVRGVLYPLRILGQEPWVTKADRV
jgi:hypothetical protein